VVIICIVLLLGISEVNLKALRAGRNPKWFDKLTTLSEVEGQIQIPNVLNLNAFARNNSVLGFLNFDHLSFDIVWSLGFRISDFRAPLKSWFHFNEKT